MRVSIAIAVSLAFACPGLAAQTPSDAAMETIRDIESDPAFAKAVASFERGHESWVDNIITLTEIPAPPFGEEARASAYRQMFVDRGLTNVEIDPEGNVLGVREGNGDGLIVVSAHLDTVFPEGTDVAVRREGNRLFAPGISDDTSGLATQLSLIEAMNEAGISTNADILFVGTVGEEGEGNLRGVRYLFTEGKYRDRITGFFSLDGSGMGGITNGAVGSKRYEVVFRGPGGHSFGAFGLPNPMAAMAQTVGELYRIQTPSDPKTTYSASLVSGGTSINAIPDEVRLGVDMRSESATELALLEEQFLAILQRAVDAENAARPSDETKITFEPELIGDRPAGTTPLSADIVQFAAAANAVEGIQSTFRASSTDSNIPISMGIPAITIPRVASAGRSHSLDEWMDTDLADNVQMKKIALATVIATAGLAEATP